MNWKVCFFAAFAGTAVSANAQLSTWTNPLDGDWSDPGNWDTLAPPTSLPQSALFPPLGSSYSVSLDADIQLADLTIDINDNLTKVVNVQSGVTLGLAGATVDGTLRINPSGSGVSRLQSIQLMAGQNTPVVFSGSEIAMGELISNPNRAAAILETTPGAPLTVDTGLRVIGAGRIRGVDESITVKGLLQGQFDLEGDYIGTTALGTPGVDRSVNSVTFVDGSSVRLMTLSNAKFSGTVDVQDCLIFNISDVLPGATIRTGGTITTNGLTLNINTLDESPPAVLEIAEDTELAGSNGGVRLGTSGDPSLAKIVVPAGKTLSLSPTSRIDGSGRIENNGSANLRGFVGRIELVGPFNLSGAMCVATVLNEATTTGGTFINVESAGTDVSTDFTNDGALLVRSGATFTARGTFANPSLIRVGDFQATPGGADAVFVIDQAGTICTGTGAWDVGRGVSAGDGVLRIEVGADLTLDAGSMIVGTTGRILAEGVLNTSGAINPSSKDFELNGNINLTGPGSVGGACTFNSAVVTGGLLNGIAQVASPSDFAGTINAGLLNIESGASLGVSGNITNNNIIVVNESQGATDAEIVAVSGPVALIDGTGVIKMNSELNAFDATMRGSAAGTLEIGSGIRVFGRGALVGPMRLGATLQPDQTGFDPYNEFVLSGDVEFTSNARLELDVFGKNAFDRLSADPFNAVNATLGGTVALALQDGYLPDQGDRFVILETNGGSVSGGFTTVETPKVGNQQFVVLHSADRVEAVWTCPADVNVDGQTSGSDFTMWLLLFSDPANPNHINADINGDGTVTQTDLTAWIDAYNAGCP
jgi:hypothetical protein